MARPAIGFLTLQSGSWADLLATWQELERVGADSIWVCDHLVSPYAPTVDWFEGWTALAALAQATPRVRAGMLVSSPTLHHPAPLAKQVVTVDHLSGGRLEVGLGAGGAPLDHLIMATGEWSPTERRDRFHEYVDLLDRLLRGHVERHDGPYYPTEAATFEPRAVQTPRPPFTIAGHARGTLQLAARQAQRWNSYGGEGVSPEESLRATRDRVARLHEECAAIGRDPAEIVHSFILGHGYVPETPFASRDAWDDFAGRYAEIGIDELLFFAPLEQSFPEGTVRPGLLDELLAEPR